VREQPDVGVLASRDSDRVTVLVWHYHDDDIPGPDARVRLVTAGLPDSATSARLVHYRVDDHHSNPYAVWRSLGSPASPDPKDYARLAQASELTRLEGSPASVPVTQGTARVDFSLGRRGVSLLVFSEFNERAQSAP
jgi:xylan 1,4-beta-xylosidase